LCSSQNSTSALRGYVLTLLIIEETTVRHMCVMAKQNCKDIKLANATYQRSPQVV